MTTQRHEIDAAASRLTPAPADQSVAEWAQPLLDGVRSFRRHAYLDDDLSSPREHGELWRRLDALEALLAHDDVDVEPKRSATIAACHELRDLLVEHNA